MSTTSNDALVIGAGVNGLVAAAFLARSGLRVAVLEQRSAPGGLCEPAHPGNPSGPRANMLYALDWDVVRALELTRNGLSFDLRDLPTYGLRAGGELVYAGRDVHAVSQSLKSLSAADAAIYPRFRRSLLAEARRLRANWWHGSAEEQARDSWRQLGFQSASALLSSWFDSDAAKAVLAFDAATDGISLDEPASSLALLWRAAQENAGLQSAIGLLRGGTASLVEALVQSARRSGVEIHTNAKVARIVAPAGLATGVMLDAGDTLHAPLILSSLPRASTYALLPAGTVGLATQPRAAEQRPIATAHIALAFDRAPNFGARIAPAARLIHAERLESYAVAHEAARAGQLSSEIVFEAVASPLAGGLFGLSVRVPMVPAQLEMGWREGGVLLAGKILAALSALDRGLKESLRQVHISTPDDLMQAYGTSPPPRPTIARFFSPATEPIKTPIGGLYLCGADVEPVSAISGRGARVAAHKAALWLSSAKEVSP